MEIFDVIYDKDALISGIVLAKRPEGFMSYGQMTL